MGQQRAAGINKAGLPARQPIANINLRSSGFILFYSLWILVSIGLMMSVVVKQQRSAVKIGSAQLDYVLQKRQLLNILDYVLLNSYEQKINNDSRAPAYLQLQASQSAAIGNALKDEFCAMFGSGNYGIVSANDALCSKQPGSANLPGTGSGPTDRKDTTRKTGVYAPAKQAYALKVKDLNYSISIWPSNAYPNLNTLNKPALKNYLRYLGLSKENALQLAGVIKDWVDSDDFTDEEGGAEWSEYSRGDQPYKPRNAPIKNWQELNFLLQAEPDLVTLLRQNFVLESTEKRVNADYVNNTQIAALAGVEQALVEKWRLQRAPKTQDAVKIDSKLDSKDQQKIDSVAGEKADTENIVIKINSGKNQITAWFNLKTKKLQDWSFTQDLPPVLPLNLNISDWSK